MMVDKEELNQTNAENSFDQAVNEPQEQFSEHKTRPLQPKLLVAVIVIFGGISVVFGVFSWLDSLKSGFAIRDAGLNQSSTNNTNNEIANALALQQQDTDLDGLSDYDEMYLYKTSPYLADSDSDGFSDGTEVKNGQNPNCPAGQNCSLVLPAEPSAAAGTGVSSIQPALENLTNEQIRQLLLDKGMQAGDLQKIDDATLRSLYQETLTEVNQGAATGINLGTTENTKQMTASELRAILLTEPGVDQEAINSLTDEELMQVWQEIMSEQGQQ